MNLKELYLKAREERRLQDGHLWIYSNEVDAKKHPLTSFQAGDLVKVLTSTGSPLGIASFNPHTLLAGRLLTRNAAQAIDENFFYRRLQNALALRESIYKEPYYRLVYGDSDELPGLVIDRFNDIYVMQLNTAGMDILQDKITGALVNLLNPKAIILRADNKHRALENLPLYTKMLLGEEPSDIIVKENDTYFHVPALTGQKTGWFYDHRNNRSLVNNWAKDKTVLDLFSYMGGWGIEAAVHGAKSVLCVDSSELAIEKLNENAKLNQVDQKVKTICGDVFDTLKQLIQDRKTFDIVVLDPPAFIKRKKDLKPGLKAYSHLNQQAMKLLNPQGLLVSASCSMHLTEDLLIDVIRYGSVSTQQNAKIIALGSQAADHPIHPAIPETHYLKTVFAKLTEFA